MLVLRPYAAGVMAPKYSRGFYDYNTAMRDRRVFDSEGCKIAYTLEQWKHASAHVDYAFEKPAWAWVWAGLEDLEVNEFGPVTP